MNLVKDVNEHTMRGRTQLHKWLNAYLTKTFILSTDVPDDECEDEAVIILAEIISKMPSEEEIEKEANWLIEALDSGYVKKNPSRHAASYAGFCSGAKWVIEYMKGDSK